METVLVSIVTVSYNSFETITETVESVNCQTYGKIEHVLIDGNSNDNTVSEFLKVSTRQNQVLQEVDRGIYDAMNKGIKLCKGAFIMFLNSDDTLASPDAVRNIVTEIKDLNSIVYGDIEFIGSNGARTRFWDAGEKRTSKYTGWHPPHPGLTVSKVILESLDGFNSSFRISADYDLILRLMNIESLNWHYVRKTLVFMKVGGASTTLRGMMISLKEVLAVYRLHGLTWYESILKLANRYLFKIAGLF